MEAYQKIKEGDIERGYFPQKAYLFEIDFSAFLSSSFLHCNAPNCRYTWEYVNK